MLTKEEKARIRKEIGERIRRAILLTGKSRRKVAEEVGISHVSLKKYEEGVMFPRMSVLEKLAKMAGVDVEYFFRGKIKLIPAESALRADRKLPPRKEARIKEKILEFLERYLEIESILGLEIKKVVPSQGYFKVKAENDLERAAEDLRARWELGLDPISDLPGILEERGIKILVLPLEEVDSLLVKFTPEAEPDSEIVAIAVRKDHPGDRQWFSLAHELGHYFLTLPSGLDERRAEEWINRFAGAFLAPAKKVFEELGRKRNHLSLKELHFLKHTYHLSMQGWIHRAEDLGIISHSYAKKLRGFFKKKNYDKREPGEQLPPVRAQRFVHLVERAYLEGLISRAKKRELLSGLEEQNAAVAEELEVQL